MRRRILPAWFHALISGGKPENPLAGAAPAAPRSWEWRRALTEAVRRTVGKPSLTEEQATERLDTFNGDRLVRLDQELRSVARWQPVVRAPSWPFDRISRSDERHHDAQLFVAACDADGHLRERVLRALPAHPSRLATAAALIRCADWVPQVQRAARVALAQLLHGEGVAHLFELADLVARLRGAQRFAASAWGQLVEVELLAARNRERRFRLLDHREASARAFGIALAMQVDHDRVPEILRSAVRDENVPIARAAFVEAQQALDEGARSELTRQTTHHPRAALRALAIRTLAARNPPDLVPLLHEFLFDRAQAPRDAAAHILRTQFGADPAIPWRAALDAPNSDGSLAALQGLANAPASVDAATFLRFLHHANARVRAVALLGVVNTKPPSLSDILESALDDTSTRVVRETVRAFARGAASLSASNLGSALARARGRPSQTVRLKAVHSLGKWEALELLLRVGSSGDVADAPLRREVGVWIRQSNRRFTPLDADCRERLLRSLEGSQSALGDELRHALREIVQAS